MDIKIDKLIKAIETINDFNKEDLKNIQLLNADGSVIKLDDDIVDDFLFVGLSNIDFIKTHYDSSENKFDCEIN